MRFLGRFNAKANRRYRCGRVVGEMLAMRLSYYHAKEVASELSAGLGLWLITVRVFKNQACDEVEKPGVPKRRIDIVLDDIK